MNMKVSAVFVLIVSTIGLTHSSAIPVWELLKKEEKTSFLYSIFAKDVEKLCSSNYDSNCLKDNLKYGLDKLKTLSDEQLDLLDPYQRGGNNLIWATLMEGSVTPESQLTTTPKPNSYEDETLDQLEFEAEGSAKVNDGQRLLPPSGFIFRPEEEIGDFQKQNNAITYSDNNSEGPEVEQYPFTSDYYRQTPLIGPLVVRVYIDGTPVEDPRRIPEDDDLRQYQLTKIKLPNF